MPSRLQRVVSAALAGMFAAALMFMPPHPAPAQTQTGTISGTVVDEDGMHNATFRTPAGTVTVHLPDDMQAGDVIAGTIARDPAGKTAAEHDANTKMLAGYRVETREQTMPPGSDSFRAYVPNFIPKYRLVLVDSSGSLAGSPVDIPILPFGARPPTLPILPKLITSGKPIVITGPFHPDSYDPKVTVGGSACSPLAESPRKLVCTNPSTTTGPQLITLEEIPGQRTSGERVTSYRLDAAGHLRAVWAPRPDPSTTGPIGAIRGTVNNLNLVLSADQYRLTRGQTTRLTVVVTGLDGVAVPVPLHIKNQSDTVLTLGCGPGSSTPPCDDQRSVIYPTEVTAGTYTTHRTLTGILPGNFSIFAEISSAIILPPSISANTQSACVYDAVDKGAELDAKVQSLRRFVAALRDKAYYLRATATALAPGDSHELTDQPTEILKAAAQRRDSLRALASAKKATDPSLAAVLNEAADIEYARSQDLADTTRRLGVHNPVTPADVDNMDKEAQRRRAEARQDDALADGSEKEAAAVEKQAAELRAMTPPCR